MPCAGVSFNTVLNVPVNVNIEVGAAKIAKTNKATLVVITQPLSLHYVFISYNMKPHFLEFMYLEREDSYTRQVCRGCKI